MLFYACRMQIGDFVISSSKTPATFIAHLGIYHKIMIRCSLWPQCSSRCKTYAHHSWYIIYLAGMGMIQGGLACSNICYERVNTLYVIVMVLTQSGSVHSTGGYSDCSIRHCTKKDMGRHTYLYILHDMSKVLVCSQSCSVLGGAYWL